MGAAHEELKVSIKASEQLVGEMLGKLGKGFRKSLRRWDKMMKEDCLWFHPLTMEASTSLTPNSLLEFVKLSGRRVEIVDFDNL